MNNSLHNKNNKTILITGGTGFIGSKVVRRLKENKNIYVKVLSRSKSDKEYSNVEYIKCDLLNELDLKRICSKIRDVDIVLHMATRMPRSSLQQEDIGENMKQNLLTTINLLKYLPKNIERFVYSSTIDIYDKPIYNPIDESHPTNPLTYYGASKLASKKYLSIFLNHRGTPLTILRYSQVYGGDKGNSCFY
jgi:UDP-glucose 4-epimerase